MDKDKAIRAAKLTLSGMLERNRHATAVGRAGGQIAPSKYLPNVPRAVHADGGRENGADGITAYHASPEDIVGQFRPSTRDVGIHFAANPDLAHNAAVKSLMGRSDMAEKVLPRAFRINARPDQIVDIPAASNRFDFYDLLEHLHGAGRIDSDTFNSTFDGLQDIENRISHPDETMKAQNVLFSKAMAKSNIKALRYMNKFDSGPTWKDMEEGRMTSRVTPDHSYIVTDPSAIQPQTVTKAEGGEVEGKQDFTRDNPGGEWLEFKQARAAQHPDRKFVVGATTGVIGGRSDMFLPTHILKGIAGLNDEVRTAGVHKYDRLMSDAQEGGFDHDQKGNKVVVAVNHYGQPYLLEGNTRVAVAHTLGIPKVKAEVRYWNGAENVDGPMHPDQVFSMASDSPEVAKAGGGAVTDTDKFRNWFGNSVTHTDGEPHVLYTGTSKDKDFTSHNVGRHGAWFTRDPEVASQYAEQNDSQGYKREGFKLTPTNTASRVIPAYVKAENPYTGELPEEYLRDNYKAAQSDWFDTLRAKGHDSWIPARYNGDLVVALKEPQQIKSIFNNGNFDPKQKHMNKAGGGEVDDDKDGITAYHGSPHSFNQFNIANLGTGEGAQAYGHGLYFAGNEKIAKHYRDTLSGRQYTALGTSDEAANKFGHDVVGIFEKSGGNRGELTNTLARLQNQVKSGLQEAGVNHISKLDEKFNPMFVNDINEVHDRAERLAGFLRSEYAQPDKGHMYKVKINAGPHELLDWDKPLSEQHPKVQRAIKEWNRWRPASEKIPQEIIPGSGIEPSGSHIYQHMVNIAQPNDGNIYGSNARGQEFASGELSDLGLKGIRYLDAGSRNLSDGDLTHNYVMFHHDPVKVVDKYEYGGMVGKAEGGEVDNNVTDLSTVRTKRDITSGDHSYGAQNMFADLAEKYAASQKAFDMAHASGAFDNFQMGDMFKYNGLPNYDPKKIVGFTVKHVSSSPNMTKLFNNHYPALEFETQDADRKVTTVPLEWFENNLHKYDKVGGKPKLVKADGGSVNKALALTRGFTKDGKSAINSLKPKRK
jgi:hypothetical protein